MVGGGGGGLLPWRQGHRNTWFGACCHGDMVIGTHGLGALIVAMETLWFGACCHGDKVT